MIFIYIFLLLVASHFICDFTLQTSAMAEGKGSDVNGFYWMTAHCATQAVGVALVLFFFHKSSLFIFTASLVEFITHYITDIVKCKYKASIHWDQFTHINIMFWITLFAAISR